MRAFKKRLVVSAFAIFLILSISVAYPYCYSDSDCGKDKYTTRYLYCSGANVYRNVLVQDFYCQSNVCYARSYYDNLYVKTCRTGTTCQDWDYSCSGNSLIGYRDCTDYSCSSGDCTYRIRTEQSARLCSSGSSCSDSYSCSGGNLLKTTTCQLSGCRNDRCDTWTESSAVMISCNPSSSCSNSYRCSGNDLIRTTTCQVSGCRNNRCDAWTTTSSSIINCPTTKNYRDEVFYCSLGNSYRRRTVIENGCFGSSCSSITYQEEGLYQDCSTGLSCTDASYSCQGDVSVGVSRCTQRGCRESDGMCYADDPYEERFETECGNFKCNTNDGRCFTSCVTDSSCKAGFRCVSGECIVKKDDGEECLSDSECVSEHCKQDFDSDKKYCSQKEVCVDGPGYNTYEEGYVLCNSQGYRRCNGGEWNTTVGCQFNVINDFSDDNNCGWKQKQADVCVEGVDGGCISYGWVEEDCIDFFTEENSRCSHDDISHCKVSCGAICEEGQKNDTGLYYCKDGDSYKRIDTCSVLSDRCVFVQSQDNDILDKSCGSYGCDNSFGRCYNECTDNSQCKSGYHCHENRCVTNLGYGKKCMSDLYCIGNKCREDYDGGHFCSDEKSCVHGDEEGRLFSDGANAEVCSERESEIVCVQGVWQNKRCSDCGHYKDATCENGRCKECRTRCDSDDDCDENSYCGEGNACKLKESLRNVKEHGEECFSDEECISFVCNQDHNLRSFCAISEDHCVYDGRNYENGSIIKQKICIEGEWVDVSDTGNGDDGGEGGRIEENDSEGQEEYGGGEVEENVEEQGTDESADESIGGSEIQDRAQRSQELTDVSGSGDLSAPIIKLRTFSEKKFGKDNVKLEFYMYDQSNSVCKLYSDIGQKFGEDRRFSIKDISKGYYNVEFDEEILEGEYIWNIYCCDINSRCSFAKQNRSFIVDKLAGYGICRSEWVCLDWEDCVGGHQRRLCGDKNSCPVPTGPVPEMQRDCVDKCNDKIQNQGEEGVDCGGPCQNQCKKIEQIIELKENAEDKEEEKILDKSFEEGEKGEITYQTSGSQSYYIMIFLGLFVAGSAGFLFYDIKKRSYKEIDQAKGYVKVLRTKGYDDQNIEEILKKKGWESNKIKKILR